MDPNNIQNMDDLREAMKDPAVKQAEAEMSKKFLKNNRPKSLMLVVVAVLAVFLLIGLTGHRGSSVIPSAMRTCEEVTVTPPDGNGAVLTVDQRNAVIAALAAVKVKRDATAHDTLEQSEHFTFSGIDSDGDDWQFSVSSDGVLYTEKSAYTVSDGKAQFLWAVLNTACE